MICVELLKSKLFLESFNFFFRIFKPIFFFGKSRGVFANHLIVIQYASLVNLKLAKNCSISSVKFISDVFLKCLISLTILRYEMACFSCSLIVVKLCKQRTFYSLILKSCKIHYRIIWHFSKGIRLSISEFRLKLISNSFHRCINHSLKHQNFTRSPCIVLHS